MNSHELVRLALRRLGRFLRRGLRSPRVIVAEVVAIAAAGVLIAVIPQTGVVGAERLARFQADHPTMEPILAALGLHAISGSATFAGLFLLAGASLLIAVGEQWRRAWREATLALTPASFRTAAYRREGERQRQDGATPEPHATYATRGRLGLFGSPVFHVGLLVLVVAGLLRMLYGQDAAVDLFEGEALPPVPEAYGAQWGGPLATPFALPCPLRLETLTTERWPDGALKAFTAQVTLDTPAGPRPEHVAVNTPLTIGGERLFLSALHGPAALLEARQPDDTERVALLLRPVSGRENAFQGTIKLHSGLEVRLRGALRPDAGPPPALEARILDGSGALLYAGPLEAGAEVSLGTRGTLALPAIRSWAQFRGSRDRALALVYVGFMLAIIGAVAMLALVRVDTAVLVTPLADGREQVIVALRAQRLAPLFTERFAALVQAHLGPGSQVADPLGSSGAPGPDPNRAISARSSPAPSPKPCGERRHMGLHPGSILLLGTLVISAALAQGCGSGGRLSDERATRLVQTYNERLIEAYRSSDPELLEGVAGPAECKKLLGLIGVKSDQGISLDATLVSFTVLAVERVAAGEAEVATEETWRYADRRIGSGDIVGQSSEDHYRMSYHLERLKTGAWVVAEVRFASAPVVGRAAALSHVPVAAHGATTAEPAPAKEP